jgi:hypothetical protein
MTNLGSTISEIISKPELYTAVFTAFIAFATIYLSRETVNAARTTMRADIYDRYSQRWDTPEMRSRRARLAGRIKSGEEFLTRDREVEDVCDFFEELGMLYEKGLLDYEFLRQMFAEYAVFYWYKCAKPYSDVGRQFNPKVRWYSGYGRLVDAVEGRVFPNVSPKEFQELLESSRFVDFEIALDATSSHAHDSVETQAAAARPSRNR